MQGLIIKAAICAALLVAAVIGWNTYTARLIAKGDAQGYERAASEMTERELVAEKRAREQEHRQTQAVQGVADATRKELEASRVAGADAERAARRLRTQLAEALRSRRSAPPPAVAGGSAPADPAADLYERVQSRLDEATDGIARFADEAHTAGKGCTRAWEVTQ